MMWQQVIFIIQARCFISFGMTVFGYGDMAALESKTMNKITKNKNKILFLSGFQIPQYPCEVCGKVFNRKPNMLRHMFVHSGEKPFQCSICMKQFNQKSNLKSHIMSVHTFLPQELQQWRNSDTCLNRYWQL